MSHRAALFAALAAGESTIENFLDAGVTRRMLAALDALGVGWKLEGSRLQVVGEGLPGLQAPDVPIDCGNSATTMRLLAGALAAAGVPAVLDGTPGLRLRPMGRIVRPLTDMGAPVTAQEGRAPLRFSGRQNARLRGGKFELDVASAQVKSCLLLAGLAADGPVQVIEPGASRDHTERMLAGMGARITRAALPGNRFQAVLEPGERLRPLNLRLPGDFSSAAFLIAAALVTPGSELQLPEVGLNPTRTGLLDALLVMGARIEVDDVREENGEPVGSLRVGASTLRGAEISGSLVVRMIDEFPALAAAAAYADGVTVIRDAAELRNKETDRIRALCTQMKAIGVDIEELPDGFRIAGNPDAGPAGGEAEALGDHRIAMALVVAGLGARGAVRVRGPEIIRESFPAFIPTLEALGARFG